MFFNSSQGKSSHVGRHLSRFTRSSRPSFYYCTQKTITVSHTIRLIIFIIISIPGKVGHIVDVFSGLRLGCFIPLHNDHDDVLNDGTMTPDSRSFLYLFGQTASDYFITLCYDRGHIKHSKHFHSREEKTRSSEIVICFMSIFY